MTKRNHMRPGTASGSRRLSDVEEGGGAGVPSVEGALDELVPLDEGPDGGMASFCMKSYSCPRLPSLGLLILDTRPSWAAQAPDCRTLISRAAGPWTVRAGGRRRRARAHVRSGGVGKQHGFKVLTNVQKWSPCQAGRHTALPKQK
jgi:hypothetical protein